MIIEWVAQRENTDLIMMPTKGHGRFRRLLLGSVSAKVLHDIGYPVLTSAHQSDAASGAFTGYSSVLCAVELNAEAHSVLRAAGFIAQAYGARVCLLHVERSRHEHGYSCAQLLRDAFAVAAGNRSADVVTGVRVLDGSVGESIRRVAIEEAADLIVVGRGHQQRSLSRMWSQLYTIIRDSPCPVLSVS